MSAFECDLKRVLTDQRHVFDPQVISTEVFHPVESTWRARFTAALGAWTSPSQLLAGVAAVNTVFPNDFHHLTLAVDVYGGGKRIGVLQLDA